MHDFVERNYSDKVQKRFWSKVFVRDLSECWPWLRSGVQYHETTYPRASFLIPPAPDGRTRYHQMNARRLAAILLGLIPPDAKVTIPATACWDPTCCNPLHLARHFAAHPPIDLTMGTEDNQPVPETASEEAAAYEVTDEDHCRKALSPLLEGRGVLLSMRTPKTRTTKVSVADRPILVAITPGVVFGLATKTVLISVVNHGSAFVEVTERSNVARLAMAGMPMALARFLVNQIHRVLGE